MQHVLVAVVAIVILGVVVVLSFFGFPLPFRCLGLGFRLPLCCLGMVDNLDLIIVSIRDQN